MPKIRKTKGIYRRGRIYWITYMGLDGKQKYESTGSELKADAELLLAQRRIDVDQGKEPPACRRNRNHTFSDLAEKYCQAPGLFSSACAKFIFQFSDQRVSC